MSSIRYIWKFSIVVFLLLCGAVNLYGQELQSNPILNFYCEKAQSVCQTLSPFENGATFSFLAQSYLTELAHGGKETITDSSIVRYYFSFGNVDSQKVILSTSSNLNEIDFHYPNLFEHNYDFSFFPNDIGNETLAIDIDCDTAINLQPVGIAIIDRNRYYLRQLFLYYPDNDKYKRYSKWISFGFYNGLIFPDTVRLTYSKAGIFSTEHYRLETVVDSLSVPR